MKLVNSLFVLLSITTFGFGQGYFDLEEVNKSSLIYGQCKIKWTELNEEYVGKFTKFKDSISNLPRKKFTDELELIEEVNAIINKQSAVYASGWGGEDFNLGLLYDYKQDSALQQFMLKNKLSYIFGANMNNSSSFLYINENLNLTTQVTSSLSNKPSKSFTPQTKLKFAHANLPENTDASSFFEGNSSSKLTLKEAAKLVAEENDIDIILKKEEMRNNITEIILYGSENLDVTELIMAKYNNRPVPTKQLKINPTISGVNLDMLIQAVGEIHPDYQKERKLLMTKFENLYNQLSNPNIYKLEEALNVELEKLNNKYIDKVRNDITRESIAMAKKLNYDILISLKSPGSGNLFDNYDEIHIAEKDNLSKRVYEVFVEKYKEEN